MAHADPQVTARRQKVAPLYNSGLSLRLIAQQLGVPRHTVMNDVHWLRHRTNLLTVPPRQAPVYSVSSPRAQPVIRPGRPERMRPRLTTVEEDLEAAARQLRRERDEARENGHRLREQRDSAQRHVIALESRLATSTRLVRSLTARLAREEARGREKTAHAARQREAAAQAREKLARTGEFTEGGQLYRRVTGPVPLVQGSAQPGRILPHSRPPARSRWKLKGYRR